MASPTVSELNQIAKVMHDAAPIYEETRKILGFIDEKDAIPAPHSVVDIVPEPESATGRTTSNDAPNTCHTVVEPRSTYNKHLM